MAGGEALETSLVVIYVLSVLFSRHDLYFTRFSEDQSSIVVRTVAFCVPYAHGHS